MAVQTAAGTAIGISAVEPETFDAAGYGALTFTTIGEVTDGGGHGRTYAEVTHNPIASRGTRKYKGSFNEGNKTLQLALDNEDAGQLIAREALHSDDEYAFEVAYPDGTADWFMARVMAFTKSVSSVDTIITATIELSITTSKDGVGIVEGPATGIP